MSDLINNKWMRAAIPALLIHCSIGTVYCWSLFKTDIADYIGRPKSHVEWAFSLAIFMLGMSAAFAGRMVERDIHKSSLLSAIFFTVGLVGTGLSVYFKSLLGLYVFYGVIMGIGLGLGYLSPVKTLMLWFSKQKGLATGLAVAGFGLAKVIASPIITSLIPTVGIVKLFYILAAIYFVAMFIGHILLKKPNSWVEDQSKKNSIKISSLLKSPAFIGIWLFFFLNITCGLALISQEKDILGVMGVSIALISIVSSLTAVFNALGRLGFSSLGDKLKDRNTVYKIIFVLSAGLPLIAALANSINNGLVILVILMMCIINAGYGGGFSNLPTLLADRFGMQAISQLHGLTLSAWAFAGIAGNQLASIIVSKTRSFTNVLWVISALYGVALLLSFVLVSGGRKPATDT